MRRRSSSGAITLALVLLAACGSPTPPLGEDVDAGGVPDARSLLYECGRGPFDASRLEGPGNLENSQTPLGDALRELLETPDGTMGGRGWRIVHEQDDEVLVAAPSPDGEHPYVSALFERSHGGWDPIGWGDCSPFAIVGRRSSATWRLAGEPSDDTTQLHLLVEERACSSGRELTEENTLAHVEYSDDDIVILVTADPLDAGKNVVYTCIGVPPAEITVHLEEPVRGRALVDGIVYPPERRGP